MKAPSQYAILHNKRINDHNRLAYSQEDDKHYILFSASLKKDKLKIYPLGRGATKKEALDEAYKRKNITENVYSKGV
jgi:hypothetical protein